MPRTEETPGEQRREYKDEDQTIFEALSRDHRTVSGLLQQLEGEVSDNAEEVKALFQVLKNELLAHSYAEDEVFYERLVEADDEMIADKIEESREEHSAIEELLSEMEEMRASSSGWMEKVRALRDMVEHHVQEEEGDVFVRASDIIEGDEQRELAHEFHAAKEQIAFETSPIGDDEVELEGGGAARGTGDGAEDNEVRAQDADLGDIEEGERASGDLDEEPDSFAISHRGKNNRPIE